MTDSLFLWRYILNTHHFSVSQIEVMAREAGTRIRSSTSSFLHVLRQPWFLEYFAAWFEDKPSTIGMALRLSVCATGVRSPFACGLAARAKRQAFELAWELEWDNQLSEFYDWDENTVYDSYTDSESESHSGVPLGLWAAIGEPAPSVSHTGFIPPGMYHSCGDADCEWCIDGPFGRESP